MERRDLFDGGEWSYVGKHLDATPETLARWQRWGWVFWSCVESQLIYVGSPEAALEWNENMAATRPEVDR